jgi:hypothetical protein
MDAFHERLARVALRAADSYGFCLAGGYAVQAHGMVDRRSEDVDLFTTAAIDSQFPEAVRAVVQALSTDGLAVVVDLEYATFARLKVTDPVTGEESKLELGVDWRAHPPIEISIGPVLHPNDAVANKICALYSRAAVRDYIDVHGAVASGRYGGAELLKLAADHDPGFDAGMFAEALAHVARVPDAGFAPYGLKPDEAQAVRDRLLAWAAEITSSN